MKSRISSRKLRSYHLSVQSDSGRSVVPVLLLGLLASACSDDMSQLRQQIAEVKSRPGERIEPLPEIKAYDAFRYDPANLRSPFVPSVSVKAGLTNSVRPDAQRPREFLEQFPLDTLQMVGTLQVQGRSFGLVQGKDGLVHRVQVGNYIGQNDGRVTSITSSKVSVIELVPDGLGGYIERPAALSLKD